MPIRYVLSKQPKLVFLHSSYESCGEGSSLGLHIEVYHFDWLDSWELIPNVQSSLTLQMIVINYIWLWDYFITTFCFWHLTLSSHHSNHIFFELKPHTMILVSVMASATLDNMRNCSTEISLHLLLKIHCEIKLRRCFLYKPRPWGLYCSVESIKKDMKHIYTLSVPEWSTTGELNHILSPLNNFWR